MKRTSVGWMLVAAMLVGSGILAGIAVAQDAGAPAIGGTGGSRTKTYGSAGDSPHWLLI